MAAIDIFEHLTIQSLAAHLRTVSVAPVQSQLEKVSPASPKPFSLGNLNEDKLSKVAAMLARKGK